MTQYSPILAITTGLIEISAFFYFSFLFKNMGKEYKILNLILFFLAGYQLLEAFNCVYPYYPVITRLSFLDITWLPALGVYFTYLTSPYKSKYFKVTSYFFIFLGFVFSITFILNATSTILKSCQLFYATYGNPGNYYHLYGLYYQSGMSLMLIFAINNLISIENKERRMLIADFAIGSALFIIPSVVLTSVIPKFRGSMPSIMCHIALFLCVFIIKALVREKKLNNLSFSVLFSSFAEKFDKSKLRF